MPPPRTGPGSDPLDPFPPLPSSRRGVMNPRRSYAAILRPSTDSPIPHPQHEGLEARPGLAGWDIDDVDPQDALDEIRSYPTSPAVFTAPTPPRSARDQTDPPWRSAQGETEAEGGRGEGGVEAGIERLPEPAERHPELLESEITEQPSVISPSSAHRPSATSNARLAPIFTLDELLGQNQAAQNDNEPSERPSASTPSAAMMGRIFAGGRNPRRSAGTRAYPSATLLEGPSSDLAGEDPTNVIQSEVDHARRTWQGGIEAANRLGYDQNRNLSNGRRMQTAQRSDEAGTSSINDPEPSSIPLRRRGRRVFPPGVGTGIHAMMNDAGYGAGDEDPWSSIAYRRALAQLEDNELAPDRLENALLPRSASGRSVRPFYSHPNITGDIDLDEWSGAFGTGLRRGGNNRRRDSLQQRIDPDREASAGAEEIMPLLAHTAAGLDPTNIETLRIAQPIIVRTSGNRRQRSLSEGSLPDKRAVQGKRRKMPDAATLPPTRPEYLSLTSLRPTTRLPDDFDRPHRNSFLHLSHSTTGRPIIKFCDGPRVTETDDDASALRSTWPIPDECGVFYYEVECLNAGLEGFMSVGWMLKSTSLHRLVGWDKGTWGWHADDGMSFNQSGSGQQFAERWSTGDTVGCGVDFTSGRAFFTKNGKMMGHRFSNLGHGLHPAVGLRSRNEELCINFSGPFRFDIDAYLCEARDNVEVDIARQDITQVPRLLQVEDEAKENEEGEDVVMGSEPVQADIAKSSPSLPASSRATAAFVLDYLQHNGYTKAFGSARSEMSRRSWVPPPGSESVPCEKLVAINQINRVLAEPESHVPLDRIESLLPVTSPLHHRMSIYQLVHLVQCAHAAKDEDQEMEAIAYGRDLRARAKHQPWAVGECDLLDEAVGHLGLEFDDASRTKWAERRARDSDLLDSHLRSASGLRVQSRLVEAIGQTGSVNSWLARNGQASATFLNIRRALSLPVRSDPQREDE